MRKIIVGAFVSMDGVMQAPGAPTEDPTNRPPHRMIVEAGALHRTSRSEPGG
jgi:hypothetical protein